MTHLADNREMALVTGYKATDWVNPVAFDEYKFALEEWTLKGIMRGGECIGAAFFKDGEVHVSILPPWRKRWATKGLLNELLAGDKVKTRVVSGHEYMFDILRRLGFVRVGDNEFVRGH